MAGDILLGRGKVQSQPCSMDGHLGKILASRSGVAGTQNVRLWLTNRYKIKKKTQEDSGLSGVSLLSSTKEVRGSRV